MILGIDASNIRGGGGLVHLSELLGAVNPLNYGITKIIIWGPHNSLGTLQDRIWLVKKSPSVLCYGIAGQLLWKIFGLTKNARKENCSLLFIPGGSYFGNFSPVVSMSQNLLPFVWSELLRYKWSITGVRLFFVRLIQIRSFKKSDGVIFLTNFAFKTVSSSITNFKFNHQVIPHGVSQRFRIPPRKQTVFSGYSDLSPFRILYVSVIDRYKHQWHVVDAISILRKEGLPVVLDLIGSVYDLTALKRLRRSIILSENKENWVCHHGHIPFEEMQSYYKNADLGLFASSCETISMILLELMASGLPIACSNRGPMPEILSKGGIYFDPENSNDIANVIRKLIYSDQLRSNISRTSYDNSSEYSWNKCAHETFLFFSKIIQTSGSK